MKELPAEKLAIYATSLLLICILTPLLTRIPRLAITSHHGAKKEILSHALFLLAAALALYFLPEFVQDEIFSPGGVVVIGSLLPIYHSIVSVCSIPNTASSCGTHNDDENDISIWLQYWIASGTLAITTEFIDDIRAHFPRSGQHWYQFEFLFLSWLLFPLTNGSSVVHVWITRPILAPMAHKVKARCEGWMMRGLVVMVNASHLWVCWFVFLSLEEEARRFVVMAVGTIYPTAASIVALSNASDDDDEDDEKNAKNKKKKKKRGATTDDDDVTFWVTYWISFSVLYLSMDYLENFLGHIRGFYSVCLIAVIYLFLPLFHGAEVVFRQILVPLSGQYENMLLRDVHRVKLEMERVIPEKRRGRFMEKAAGIFSSGVGGGDRVTKLE